MRTNLLSLAVVLLVIVELALHPPAIHWNARTILASTLIAVALPLFLLARWQLGASFAVRAKARSLVTTGLYARIRNPIYLFGGLMLGGISLFVSAWGPLLVALAVIPLQIVRSRNEERVLLAAFGEEYQRYRAKTWF